MYAIIVAAFFAVAAVVSESAQLYLCGYSGETVDNVNRFCCNGSVHDVIKNGKTRGCCGEQIYPSEQKECCGNITMDIAKWKKNDLFCCNGRIKERTDSINDCCVDPMKREGLLFNNAKYKCCAGRLHERGKERLQCCGSNGDAFIKRHQRCSNGEVVNVARTGMCRGPNNIQNDYTQGKDMCCPDTGYVIVNYDPDRNRNKRSYEPNSKLECRQNKLFDPDIEHEVEGEIIPKGMGLCNGVQYVEMPSSTIRQHCCGGNLVKSIVGYNVKCCGTALYGKEEVCCQGKILTSGLKCCAGVEYNENEKFCCNNSVISKNGPNICCDITDNRQQLRPKQDPAHTDCCGNTTYNKYDQECTGDELHLPRITKPRTRAQGRTCPFSDCGQGGQRRANPCTKRHVYHIFVYEVKTVKFGIHLKAVISQPNQATGTFELILVIARTGHRCSCFQEDTMFYLYTNRRIDNKKKLRFTSKDFIIREEDKPSDGHYCTIDKWAKKTIT